MEKHTRAPRAREAAQLRKRRHPSLRPLMWGGEAFEGADILEELPDALGGLLWNSLRNLTFWARAPKEARRNLFPSPAGADRLGDLEQAEIPPPLEQPLRSVASLLVDPADAQISHLSYACKEIARWAADGERFGTAIAYGQAAAILDPGDAAAAYLVGRWTRKRAEGSRAESWFRYAITQARNTEDWESYALAHIGLGNLHSERGNFPLARRALSRAVRAARRHGHRRVVAMALHDLFAIAAETGRMRVAERLAARAAEAYGAGHPRLPNLAQDLAFLWTLHGRFAPALALQERIRSQVNGFPERLFLESAIARAAAGAGTMDVYERAAAEALTRVPDPEVREGVAAALLNLAYAATSAGEWDRAVRTAERARRISEQTQEGKVRLEAEAVQDNALHQLQIAPWVERADAPQPASEEHMREVSEAFYRLLAVESA